MASESKKELLERGTVLGGKWEILRRVGVGGKGEIYRARQIALDRDVAVKIMSPDFMASLDDDEEEQTTERERFRREVLAMAKVSHPNVLQVFDYETAEVDGRSLEYIVMEYVPGTTLRSCMPVDGFREDEAAVKSWIADYFFPVLDGLEVVHARGVIHRDLKPENILLDGCTPKITDFGLAGGAVWSPLTRSHHSLGTLIYMAPEQFSDMDLTDVRADLYPLGKMLYEAVTGKLGRENARPFQQVGLEEPAGPFFKELDRIVRWATAKNPDERLPSVSELRRVLTDLLEGKTLQGPVLPGGRPRRSHLSLYLAAALVLTIAAGLWVHFRGAPVSPTPGREVHGIGAPSADFQALPPKPWTAGASYTGADGAGLMYVPAAEFTLMERDRDEGRPVSTPGFFMGENEVTNHQYVEFLNQVRARLRVEEGAVRAGDEIWFFPGEVEEGYEPVAFDGHWFRVANPALASNPVVRVTASGARAYAEYYGRRLPTLEEWFHAAGARHLERLGPEVRPESSDSGGMHSGGVAATETGGFGSVGNGAPNRYGLRGLDGGVSEWAAGEAEDGETPYFVMGGILTTGDPAKAVRRTPGEGFARVGFRTVYQPGN